MTAKIKIGVLGCSSIAKRLLIPAINKSDKFSLSGVASRSLTKAEQFAEDFNTNGYSYKDLLDSDVEAIYVSLPVALHYEWGKKVLEAKKHLLLEKTFTQTFTQAKELFGIASKNNIACAEALMYKFHPLQNQIDNLLKSIGDIKCVEAHFGFPHFKNKNDIRYSRELGGGASLDCLVYPLSFVFRVLGNNFIDYNPLIFYHKLSGVDERGYLQLKYPDSVANISYGFGHSYRNEVTVWGTEAILKVNRVFTRPEGCVLPIEVWRNGQCEIHKTQNSNHFLDMLHHFSNNIKTLKNSSVEILDRVSFIEELLTASCGVEL